MESATDVMFSEGDRGERSTRYSDVNIAWRLTITYHAFIGSRCCTMFRVNESLKPTQDQEGRKLGEMGLRERLFLITSISDIYTTRLPQKNRHDYHLAAIADCDIKAGCAANEALLELLCFCLYSNRLSNGCCKIG